ncbi:DUF4328 domain-containing protein [Rhodococcus sp. ARC_M6]|uniref:DUF4328 domain-containing protein n=1 Tax=Rhodococcus sp. ARC_M6 TaxID=2928852 RepID=UPI001FB51715|nr:DUF4328 domain-containing protein [Rhodococcus sp. ARC_M6]MCJ0906947.1 DUF4328 domain-containing protein [Rhodococcus sp. ARC_M6]
MNQIQVCARCAARWPVIGPPAQWCPRCSGVLLVPVRSDAYLPPSRRGFRWIARTPNAPRGVGDPRPPRQNLSTPHYDAVPQWGLTDVVDTTPAFQSRAERMADRLGSLLTIATVLYGLAVFAEIGRYAILVRNQTRLIPQVLLTVSDAAVYFTQLGGLLCAVLAAVAAVCWLLRQRREQYAREKRTDPRSRGEIILGCALPVLNLVMPAMYLLELVRRDPRGVRLVKIWWGFWAFSGLLLVVNAYWRSRPGLQAMADGVLLSAFIALIAALTAALTLLVVRRIEHKDWRGEPESATRWVPVPRSVLEQSKEKETAAL